MPLLARHFLTIGFVNCILFSISIYSWKCKLYHKNNFCHLSFKCDPPASGSRVDWVIMRKEKEQGKLKLKPLPPTQCNVNLFPWLWCWWNLYLAATCLCSPVSSRTSSKVFFFICFFFIINIKNPKYSLCSKHCHIGSQYEKARMQEWIPTYSPHSKNGFEFLRPLKAFFFKYGISSRSPSACCY